jgi:hypothetical protein
MQLTDLLSSMHFSESGSKANEVTRKKSKQIGLYVTGASHASVQLMYYSINERIF